MFKTNEGSFDRTLRVIAGVVLLALFFMYPAASWRYWTLIGIVPLVKGWSVHVRCMRCLASLLAPLKRHNLERPTLSTLVPR